MACEIKLEKVKPMNIAEPLRECIECGLKAWTEDDLEKFVKGKDRKYGRRNDCKLCFSKKQVDYAKRRRQRRREQEGEPEPKPLRKCRDCGLEAWTEEELDLFAKAKKNKYGRRNQCKKCCAAEAREYRKRRFEDKGLCRRCRKKLDRVGYYCTSCLEDISKYMRLRHWNLRKDVIEKLGGKCVKCGLTDLRLLVINHKEGRNYRNTIDKGNKFYTRILSGERKTDDLEVRCYNCNVLFEFEKGYRQVPEGFKVDYLYGF